VLRSFLCGAVMKFSFLGLPLFFGGRMLRDSLPTRVGYVTVVISPLKLGRVTEVTSKATIGSVISDSPSVSGYTLAPRFSVLYLLNISCTVRVPSSTGFCCIPWLFHSHWSSYNIPGYTVPVSVVFWMGVGLVRRFPVPVTLLQS
jgi:hypothetical protein